MPIGEIPAFAGMTTVRGRLFADDCSRTTVRGNDGQSRRSERRRSV